MSFLMTELITLGLIALFFTLSSIELLKLSRQPQFFKIWNYQHLQYDLLNGLPIPGQLTNLLFSNQSFKWILFLQMILSILLIPLSSPWIVAAMFILHLIICIRFRGTFNGGSDMMAFVLLTGALIFTSFENPESSRFGFLYIAIHTIYSYFKAGYSKLVQRDWRSGKALAVFLNRSLYPDIQKLSDWLSNQKVLSLFACWIVISFEIMVLFVPLFPNLISVYFLISLIFHFSVFLTFGLNRFFWAWLAAWPSVFYSLIAFGFTTK